MRYTEPKAEWWPQSKTSARHIARVGRLCYKSAGKQPPAELLTEEDREAFRGKRDQERCNDFWKSGHKSMFRHGTAYYYISNDKKLPPRLWALLEASPYINYAAQERRVWISTNMQYRLENPDISAVLEPYSVTEAEFIHQAVRNKFTEALALLRMTFVVTTQISTSRELNRTSPNAIAEQSTRYCNLEKKGGVMIAEPHWYAGGTMRQRFLFNAACRVSEWAYRRLLRSGMKPQDARGVLPLDTYTVAAYTYNISEWEQIIKLRFHGTTGAPHPNAKLICGQIRDAINARLKDYTDYQV